MKILTLNTHSLVEENYSDKLGIFVDAITKICPDIIALQEVNQSCSQTIISLDKLGGYLPSQDNIEIRQDNHIYNVSKLLRKRGIHYYWTWVPIKKGYDIYDEGIGLMSLSPIIETKIINVSQIDDYNNWKTRKIIGIRTEDLPNQWFYSVHFGWWNDGEESFSKQWNKAQSSFDKDCIVWAMGDFNNPAQVRNEGYDMLQKLSWYDTYSLAAEKDDGITVGTVIDGWHDKLCHTNGMRIDQIWCNKPIDIRCSKVIFNGENYPVVSDHYGVIVDI